LLLLRSRDAMSLIRMDEKIARAILGGKLVFGDPLQIAARDLIAQVDVWRMRLARCKRCGGSGLICSRRGARKRRCECLRDASNEVLTALGFDVAPVPIYQGD
jgi:hypothetical protein